MFGLAFGCGSAPGVPPRAVPPRSQPAPLDIPVGALSPHGTLMLGDLHGTREIPAFVGRVVAQVAAREPVVLALEIPTDNAPALAAYMASDGGAAARSALVAGPWWQEVYQDGRRSVAMADLIETARALHAAGKPVELIPIDPGPIDAVARDTGMARNVIAARKAHPDAALIVFAGNLHVRKSEWSVQPGFRWMAMHVVDAGVAVVSLNPQWSDGTGWICRDAAPEHCGVSFVGGLPTEPGIRLTPEPEGSYDGTFGVGAVSASPPAGIPASSVGLDAKIDAAIAAHAHSSMAH